MADPAEGVRGTAVYRAENGPRLKQRLSWAMSGFRTRPKLKEKPDDRS